MISIDPGLRSCGVALWNDSTLTSAFLLKGSPKNIGPDAWQEMRAALIPYSYQFPHAVIEFPQVYVRSRSKGDPNDLLQIAAIVGGLSALFTNVEVVRPAEWKGQVPKEVTRARAQARLSAGEISRVSLPTKSLEHNVWDAIGIGLWKIKRS